jgi:hypothetical protein
VRSGSGGLPKSKAANSTPISYRCVIAISASCIECIAFAQAARFANLAEPIFDPAEQFIRPCRSAMSAFPPKADIRSSFEQICPHPRALFMGRAVVLRPWACAWEQRWVAAAEALGSSQGFRGWRQGFPGWSSVAYRSGAPSDLDWRRAGPRFAPAR